MQPIAVLTAWTEPARKLECRVEIGFETCTVLLEMSHAIMSQTVLSRGHAIRVAAGWREQFADSSPIAA